MAKIDGKQLEIIQNKILYRLELMDQDHMEVYDIEDVISVYELFIIIVLRDELSLIEIFDININEKILFEDEKRKIYSPYFKIKRKVGNNDK